MKGVRTWLYAKGHSSVKGNEQADTTAKTAALVGRMVLKSIIATQTRKPTIGQNPIHQLGPGRFEVPAYGQRSHESVARSDRAPQQRWLHRIGKETEPTYTCDHESEDGHDITFVCQRFKNERREMLETRSPWEGLDALVWVKEGHKDPYDEIEAFFSFILSHL